MKEVAPANGTKGPTYGCGLGDAEQFRYPHDSLWEFWDAKSKQHAGNKFIGERTGAGGEGPYKYRVSGARGWAPRRGTAARDVAFVVDGAIAARGTRLAGRSWRAPMSRARPNGPTRVRREDPRE